MQARKNTLIDIGAGALPSVTPAAPRRASWFPTIYVSPDTPPVEGVTPEPVADGVLIEWAAVDQAGVVYIIERGPTQQGPWTEIYRTTETRYLYSDGSGQTWFFRITASVRGKPGQGAVVEATPVPTTEQLIEQRLQLEKEISDRIAADANEAAARAQRIAKVTADLVTETQARVSAIAQAMDAISAESAARVDGLLNEKLAREAAITAEQQTRQSEVESLSRALSEVAAGSGTQFDSKRIWYFDQTVEDWSGNGVPTLVDGWLRPANAAANPYVQSPAALAIDGAVYRYVKLRIRKVGAPTWAGVLQWTTTADGAWNTAKRLVMDEPAWDSDGVAIMDATDVAWWPATLSAIRLQPGTAQTVSNYYLIDWVAIGRPTPGASVALVQEETQARITALAAEASQRNTLAVQMRGNYTGNDLAGVTQGFVADERTARVAADSAQVSRITTMEARMPAGSGKVATEASVTSEAQARVSGDQANASDITAVKAQLDGKASAAALTALDTKVTNIDGRVTSQGTAITSVTAKADGLAAGIGNLKVYNITASAGISAQPSGAPRSSGIRNAAGVIQSGGTSRGFRLTVINADGTLGTGQGFDTYADANAQGQAFADAVAAVPEGQFFVVATSDNVGNIQGLATGAVALRAALIDAGGSARAVGLVNGVRMYVLVGRRKLGAGAGTEVLSPAQQGATRTDMWCEYNLQVSNGVPVGMDGNRAIHAGIDATAAATSLLDGKVTSLEGTVVAQGQALTTVSAQLQNIGGDNLLMNSSLEERTSDGAVPMRYVTSSSGTFTVSYVDSPLPGSTKALRMFRAGADGGAYLGVELQAADRPKVTPGKKYVSTVYARGPAGQRMDGYIQFLTASNAGNGTIQVQFAVTADFQRYVLVSPYAAPAGSVTARVFWRAHNSGTVGDLDLTIDNVQFQEGEVPTAWMPSGSEMAAASAANASATNALTTRVTAAEGSLTSMGQSVTSVSATLNGLRTVGDNMLANSDFADGAAWWQVGGSPLPIWSGTNGDGKAGFLLDKTGTATNPSLAANGAQWLPSRGIRRYRAIVRARGVSGAMNLMLRLERRNRETGATNNNDKTLTLTTSFVTYTVDFDAVDATAGSVRLWAYCWPNLAAIRIDRVELYDVTDQQSSEANASGLSSLTATVTQQGGLITAQGTRIDSVQVQVDGKASAQALLQLDAKVSASAAGGGNLAVNALFDGPVGVGTTPGWEGFWSPDDVQGLTKYFQQGPGFASGGSDPGVPVGMRALIVAGTANRTGISYVWPAADVPVEGNKPYIFSVYASGVTGSFIVSCLNTAGTEIGRGSCPMTNLPGGGNAIENYVRLWAKFNAPAGTATMRIHLVTQHVAGQAHFVRWLRPMLEQVTPDKTGPSPWSAGGNESYANAALYTDVNGVIAGLEVRNNGLKSEFKIRADVLRVLAPGGADGMEWQNGYIRVYRGNSQRIIGNGFGVPGEGLVDYFGPNVGAAAASKANATMWMDDGGNAYWGGSLAAGVLRNAVQTTTTITVGASVTTGMFSTNGRNKAVTIGFSRRHSRFKTAMGSQGFVAGAGANGATINVYRTLNGQGEVLWQQFGVGGSVEILNEFDGPDQATSTWGGSISINDPADGSTQRSYRAEVVGFTEQTVTHQSGSFEQQTITQSLSLVSIEQ
ncbi:hypothetical protein SOM22_08675 [Stenotrophomonas rhizophila]|uniref:hypothetical protein n=1 Tax=Stenotrophomonas rhizophila TaxID=216778 RepID=UPI002A69BD9E|nr:hypothetical protein [Stenotrophomonas rhizophila]MDY0954649.1 hypothetical protein [Stenotrophomonas rhizophila]